MHKIADQKILDTLSRLHLDAKSDKLHMLAAAPKMLIGKLKPQDMKNAYLSISPAQGEHIYDLLVEANAKNIVEFGTSFGISTLYLAAAAKQTGGSVITSELLPEKCVTAQNNFNTAGVDDVVDLREGDALETLCSVEHGIDFLLLDGWNNLYLPVLKLLEPKLKHGAYIYTDNASFPGMGAFLDYIHNTPSKFESTRMKTAKGDIELTKYLKRP